MINTLEDYYGSARNGTLACVQRTDIVSGEQYVFTRVLDSSGGKIKTVFGLFWAVNGERIDSRWNGDNSRLVVPTIARVEAEEANLTSPYQFGTDRKFELAAARAVLERRAIKMPNVPPPPIPTLEEAEAELRAATAHWMSVDQLLDSPSNSTRVRKEASERLAAARTSLQLATKLHPAVPKKVGRSEFRNRIADKSAQNKQTKENIFASKTGFGTKIGVRFNSTYNSVDAAAYTFNMSTVDGIKRG